MTKQLTISSGITIADVRAIRSSTSYQQRMAAAASYIPSEGEIKAISMRLFRELTCGRMINNGEGVQVSLADVLDDEDGYESLVAFYRGTGSKEEISNLVMKACLRMTTPVIREELRQRIESEEIAKHQRLKSIAKIGEVAA
ncbi:hypothetical protein NFC81_09230 [Salinispirillum sp. LH 10-3-1]|uniref:Uncharacterized protein n=1 Tax=Salinispirillum sp. LH 10-3-1 TaxID=2952525 RepID=A0AB38YC21_9GAMM